MPIDSALDDTINASLKQDVRLTIWVVASKLLSLLLGQLAGGLDLLLGRLARIDTSDPL